MSSTKRGRARVRHDTYPTPYWCIARFLEEVPLPAGSWLEPCGGEGAIIQACDGPGIFWTTWEIREEAMSQLSTSYAAGQAYHGDFLYANEHDLLVPKYFHVGISNPPFNLAIRFIHACRGRCDHTVMLLRLNFLASDERSAFMRLTKPDVYVLPNRPSFVLGGKTDSIEYAWFHWHEGSTGVVRVLASTPISERRPRRIHAGLRDVRKLSAGG